DLGERLALIPLERRVAARVGDLETGWPAARPIVFVLPARSRRGELLLDPLTFGRVLKALDDRGPAALLGPWRQERGEESPGAHVRIEIRRDVEALVPCVLDLLDDGRHTAPVLPVGHFEMRDLRWDIRFACDPEHLIERRVDGVALAADVRLIDATVFGGHLRHLDELAGPVEPIGRVHERRENAERAP